VGVSTNKTILAKLRQQSSLEGMTLKLSLSGVHFKFNFVYSLDDVLAYLKCYGKSTDNTKFQKKNTKQNQMFTRFNSCEK
jgi:hypothetical protein